MRITFLKVLFILSILSVSGCNTVRLTPSANNESKLTVDQTGIVTETRVYAENYNLKIEEKINGEWQAARDYIIKGVCWNPVPNGVFQTADYAGFVEQDAGLMKSANINTIRAYENFPMTPAGLSTLDKLHEQDIKVIMNVYANVNGDEDYIDVVNYFKHHPAILMWLVGNEINYNKFYTAYDDKVTSLTMEESIVLANKVSAAIKSNDTNHPVAVSWGYWFGDPEFERYINSVTEADIFAIQSYPTLPWTEYVEWRGATFDQFAHYKQTLKRKVPMFLSEYGADSYNNNTQMEVEDAQALAVKTTTEGIRDNLSALDNGEAVVIGGTIFEWNDEWWKTYEHTKGSISAQDPGGFDPPGTAPYPDGFFNEEYFGIVKLDRTPKQAYYSLQKVYSSY